MKLALVLLLAASVAHADGVNLGGGLALEISGKQLVVRQGKEWAQLDYGTSIIESKIDAAKHSVTVSLEVPESVSCQMRREVTYGFDALRARIANRSAYLLHVAKDYKGAAAGYARAVALDPHWDLAAFNLASADVELKNLDGAIAALAPWLASQPIATYIQVSTDPELQPLLARPELAAIQAKTAGTAPAAFVTALYAPERGLVALRDFSSTYFSCKGTTTLHIYEIAHGREVASIIESDPSDFGPCSDDRFVAPAVVTPKAKLAARAALQTGILARLGFSQPKIETSDPGTSVAGKDGTKYKAIFPVSKIGIVVANNTAHVLTDNKTLGSAPASEKLATSYYLPEAHVAIVNTYRVGSETCGPDPITETAIIALQM